jgi:PPOX class probable F420-dependent enzyme
VVGETLERVDADMSPSGLDRAREIAARESGLAVAVTIREDGTAHASVVNAGVLTHPVTGQTVVAFVSRGGTRKLVHLRRRPRATVVFRSGWQWVAVEGDTELAGPDDPLDELDPAHVPGLLRDIYASAAGGSPADWAALDQAIADERHTAVLMRPDRIYSA